MEDVVCKDARGNIVVCAVAGYVCDWVGGLHGAKHLRRGRQQADLGHRGVCRANLVDAAFLRVCARQDGHLCESAILPLQRGAVDVGVVVNDGVEGQGLLVDDILDRRGVCGAHARQVGGVGAGAAEGAGKGSERVWVGRVVVAAV